MTITNKKSSRKDAKKANMDCFGKKFFVVLGVLASLRERVSLVLTLEGVAK
jgi:hypothetical protein